VFEGGDSSGRMNSRSDIHVGRSIFSWSEKPWTQLERSCYSSSRGEWRNWRGRKRVGVGL
jgi:hypothetical protein